MITKAIVQSINAASNRCIVRMPLFETAANANPVEAEALVNISPGMFNNLEVNDVVFVSFEEGAIEKPIILGKLFRGVDIESNIHGGSAILDSMKVRSTATLPSSTLFYFPSEISANYRDLNTPKKIADYVKWIENFIKNAISKLEEHFSCFKSWTQWQLRPENVEIDDGDLDVNNSISEPLLYQKEGDVCKVCQTCKKNNKRDYLKLPIDKNYPNM